MSDTFRKMLIGLVGGGVLLGAIAPVAAAPMATTAPAVSNENVLKVDDHWRGRGGHWGRGHWGGGRGGHWRGPGPGYRPGFWNGHHGYRYYRPGYRLYDDGWWYPLAAFGAGAVIGGALAAPPPPPPPPAYYRPGYSDAHVQWCYNRYRSYRAYDNTFQPNYGPRQQCYSPYR